MLCRQSPQDCSPLVGLEPVAPEIIKLVFFRVCEPFD